MVFHHILKSGYQIDAVYLYPHQSAGRRAGEFFKMRMFFQVQGQGVFFFFAVELFSGTQDGGRRRLAEVGRRLA